MSKATDKFYDTAKTDLQRCLGQTAIRCGWTFERILAWRQSRLHRHPLWDRLNRGQQRDLGVIFDTLLFGVVHPSLVYTHVLDGFRGPSNDPAFAGKASAVCEVNARARKSGYTSPQSDYCHPFFIDGRVVLAPFGERDRENDVTAGILSRSDLRLLDDGRATRMQPMPEIGQDYLGVPQLLHSDGRRVRFLGYKCGPLIRVKGAYRHANFPESSALLAGHVYLSTWANNQPDWKQQGKVFVESENGGPELLLTSDDYELVKESPFYDMTDEQAACVYVENGGVRCIYCGSEDISQRSLNTDAGIAWATVVCGACGNSWRDQYKLTGVDLG